MAITKARARELASKYSFRVSFDLQRRLNRALHRLTRPPAFPSFGELARHAERLKAGVTAAIPIIEASAAADGALLAAVRAVAQTRRDMLTPHALRDVVADLRALMVKLARLRYDASRADKRTARRTGRTNLPARAIVAAVLPIWEEGTGTQAGYTRDAVEQTYSGPFVSFMRDVAAVIGFDASTRAALGYAVERVIRDIKEARERDASAVAEGLTANRGEDSTAKRG